MLEIDASGYMLNAVLMQEFEDGLHPVAFHFHSLLYHKICKDKIGDDQAQLNSACLTYKSYSAIVISFDSV